MITGKNVPVLNLCCCGFSWNHPSLEYHPVAPCEDCHCRIHIDWLPCAVAPCCHTKLWCCCDKDSAWCACPSVQCYRKIGLKTCNYASTFLKLKQMAVFVNSLQMISLEHAYVSLRMLNSFLAREKFETGAEKCHTDDVFNRDPISDRLLLNHSIKFSLAISNQSELSAELRHKWDVVLCVDDPSPHSETQARTYNHASVLSVTGRVETRHRRRSRSEFSARR